ncbi:hypothetical protein C5O19_17470 [Siphonobacter curvatus]|uniref:D-alanyl-D-alanine carboxypeptidase/D-alanyl-D-alanine-endopeptidase n=2 Tax=Siphonobacter curvatus TaxID=2094562 RepID=A0A2S7IIP9_9BACT|nr:hypothetical protein C5O19_17470 [Siphonobacter curvatus]
MLLTLFFNLVTRTFKARITLSPMKFLWYCLLCLVLLGQSSCRVSRQRSSLTSLDTLWQSNAFQHHHAGLMILDADTRKVVYQHNAERYFVPASNTKLFTFYAGMKMLGDSIEALRYVVQQDSLIFWGTGDPSLLNPNLPSTKVVDFLQSRSEKLYFWPGNPLLKPYGPGWAWDDYNDYYQAERTSLPLYGNVVRFTRKSDQTVQANPSQFRYTLDTLHRDFQVRRAETENLFYGTKAPIPLRYEQDVPFRTSTEVTLQLLSDTLQKPITPLPAFTSKVYQPLRSVASDTLFKRMLQPSDNFLAEQILLLVCAKLEQPFDPGTAIDYMLNNHLRDLPDAPHWVDGSGLSRYNLFTPRSIVALLEKLLAEVPRERLFPLLAVGGQSGTLRNSYRSADRKPYLFGKTGSLSTCYNLSGYLLTKTGKTLLVSFMNNNFNRPTSEVRKEVERVLTAIHEQY